MGWVVAHFCVASNRICFRLCNARFQRAELISSAELELRSPPEAGVTNRYPISFPSNAKMSHYQNGNQLAKMVFRK